MLKNVCWAWPLGPHWQPQGSRVQKNMEETGISSGSRGLIGREGREGATLLEWLMSCKVGKVSVSFREGTIGKGDMEVKGSGVAEEARSVAETAWKPGLLTPSLVLISILRCLHFPVRVEDGEGSSGSLEDGFPSNDNRIDGGGVSRDHWGQPARPS